MCFARVCEGVCSFQTQHKSYTGVAVTPCDCVHADEGLPEHCNRRRHDSSKCLAVQRPHQAWTKATEQVQAINHYTVRPGTDTDSLRLPSHYPELPSQLPTVLHTRARFNTHTHMCSPFTHLQDATVNKDRAPSTGFEKKKKGGL